MDWKHFTKLGFAVLIVQAVFWLVIEPYFISPERGKFAPFAVESLEIASLEQPDLQLLESADWAELDQSGPFPFKRGYYGFRASFAVESVPDEGLAMLTRNDADNLQMYINGALFYGEGRMELPDITYESVAANSTMHRIPAPMLREGANTLELILVYSGSRDQAIGAPLIGQYKEIEAAFSWQKFLINEVPLISVTVGFVLSIFLFFAMLRSEKKDFLFWFFALTFAWSLRNFFFSWTAMPFHGNDRLLFYALVTLSLSVSWPMMADAWCGTKTRWYRVLAIGTFAVAACASIYFLQLSGAVDAFSSVETILDNAGIFLISITLARLLWHFATNHDTRYWEASFLIMLALLLALLLINLMLWDRHPSYLRITQPLFLFAFVVAFVLRNFRLFQSSAQIAELLQGKLDLREAELEAAHAREKQLSVKQAHSEERDRIMRDMHDGIGNSLVSILMMAKLGKAKHSEYAAKVQNVIDEMRLTIDSGETVGKSLQAVLSVFRKRIVPRAKDAGFKVDWQNNLGDQIYFLGPNQGLQIFRIMQEAVTNALKHSGGDEISITVTLLEQGEHDLEIAICDNGKGLSKVGAKGFGISNMRSRAAGMGGAITIDGNASGTRVALRIARQGG